MIKFIAKPAIVLGLIAVAMASVATPSSARNRWVGPAVGFAAGVAVGSAIANANANAYYNDPYANNRYPYGPYYGGDYYASGAPYPYYRPYQKCSPDTNAGRADQGC